jgi:hypothetical protein
MPVEISTSANTSPPLYVTVSYVSSQILARGSVSVFLELFHSTYDSVLQTYAGTPSFLVAT